jgi:hypothetical protein
MGFFVFLWLNMMHKTNAPTMMARPNRQPMTTPAMAPPRSPSPAFAPVLGADCVTAGWVGAELPAMGVDATAVERGEPEIFVKALVAAPVTLEARSEATVG